MSEPWYCAFCHTELVHYGTGRSEFEHSCDACGAGFSIDQAAGIARARVWDRHTAKGVQHSFSLDRLSAPPQPQPPEG